MRRSSETIISTIVLAFGVVAMTSCGVLSGVRQDWGGLGFCFFLAIDLAVCLTVVLLNHKIESRFTQLAELLVGKYEQDQFVRKFVPTSIMILTLTFRVVIVLLLILAFKRNWGLILGILLVVFLIGNAFSMAVTVWLKIKACSKRLEQLLSYNRES